jgi:hypothetical protein
MTTSTTIVIFQRLMRDSHPNLRDLSLKKGITVHMSTMFNTMCLHMRSSNSMSSRRRSDFKLMSRVTLRRTLCQIQIKCMANLASQIVILTIPEEEELDLTTKVIKNNISPRLTKTPTILMITMMTTTLLTTISHLYQTIDSESKFLASFCNNY